VPSEQVLRTEADEAIDRVLSLGAQIVIAGGSHSGFSCADYLLKHFGNRIRPAQIRIASPYPIRRYYACIEEAPATALPDAKLDPITGQVNRFSGIRGDAAVLWQNIDSGKEGRIVLDIGEPYAYQTRQDSSTGLVIFAAGYEPRRVPLFDTAGHQIMIAYSRSNALTSPSGNLTTENGRVLESLYGLGLGHALRGVDGYQVGINFFHGDAATRILQRESQRDSTTAVCRQFQQPVLKDNQAHVELFV
jgi:hypothetical protein